MNFTHCFQQQTLRKFQFLVEKFGESKLIGMLPWGIYANDEVKVLLNNKANTSGKVI